MTDLHTPGPHTPGLLRSAAPGRGRRAIGWLLLLGWILVGVGWFLSPAQRSYDDLQMGVAEGDVHRVVSDGELGMEPGTRGAQVVRLTWRDGWRSYHTEVVEARPLSEASGVGEGTEPATRDVRADLERQGADVELVQGAAPGDRWWTATSEIGDRELGGPWSALVLLCGLGQLVLLVSGPTPYRATRWAWFWLGFTAMPLGNVVYLLLSGATLDNPPRPGARVLTGGWAFLLALVLGSLVANAAFL